MYTVSFYSFKGGVGRTLALANVAIELVKRGKNVLLLDFDLEAPGLDTFDFYIDASRSGGLVELVTEYLNSGVAPLIDDYVSSCHLDNDMPGKLYMISAGFRTEDYSTRLNAIDWSNLYQMKSGYLLFEDIKEQVSQLGIDYFLIDSRTGHSDVEGICTRQLPDSLVFLFFPNLQNLEGLKSVVSRVEEGEKIRGKNISRHFVVSNIPDLDDEDKILESRLEDFKKALGYQEDPIIIHRYNSLSLLNQAIFIYERPKTRLAEEYRGLTNYIVNRNLEDESAAISLLRNILSNYPFEKGDSLDDIKNVDRVIEIHKRNPEIQYMASIIKERYGDYQEAFSLISNALESGYKDTSAYIRRARMAFQFNRQKEAMSDVKSALSHKGLRFSEVSQGIALILKYAKDELEVFVRLPAVKSLDCRELVGLVYGQLQHEVSTLPIAKRLMLEALDSLPDDALSDRRVVEHNLGLIHLALGEFSDAKEIYGRAIESGEDSVSDLFNYSMAFWGKEGIPHKRFLQKFVTKMKSMDVQQFDANSKQCLSLSLSLTGDLDNARFFADDARRSAEGTAVPQFSAWSYLYEDADTFLEHITQMKRFFVDDSALPDFLLRAYNKLF